MCMHTQVQQHICGGQIGSLLPHGTQELNSGCCVLTTLSNLAESSLLHLFCYEVAQDVLNLVTLIYQALDC